MNKLSIELSENNVGCYVNTNLKNIDEEQTLEIKKLLNKHGVLFFKDQNLSPEEYIGFASHFGKPAEYPMLKPHKDFKDIYVIERKKTDTGKNSLFAYKKGIWILIYYYFFFFFHYH